MIDGRLAFEVLNLLLLGIAVVVALAVVQMRSLFAAVMLFGLYSLILALVWQNLDAVDVSFTEAAVGAGVSTILLLGALVHIGRDEPTRGRRVDGPALLIVVATGVALVVGTRDMPSQGDPAAPVHGLRNYATQRIGAARPLPAATGADGYRAEWVGRREETWRSPDAIALAQSGAGTPSGHAYPDDDWDGHVPNSVTALLAGYRGFDTLLETAVILGAGLSLVLLLRRRQDDRPVRPRATRLGLTAVTQAGMHEQVLVRVVAQLLFPFIILHGLYVIIHGEIGPGGGFQGGVIIASGFILYGIVFGRARLERVLPHRVSDLLAASGVLLYGGVGLAAIAAGGDFLDHRALFPTWPALGLSLAEYGVGLTVSMVMVTIFNKITEPTLTAADGAGP